MIRRFISSTIHHTRPNPPLYPGTSQSAKGCSILVLVAPCFAQQVPSNTLQRCMSIALSEGKFSFYFYFYPLGLHTTHQSNISSPLCQACQHLFLGSNGVQPRPFSKACISAESMLSVAGESRQETRYQDKLVKHQRFPRHR